MLKDDIRALNVEEQGGSSALVAIEMRKRKAALFPSGVEWDASRFDS